MEQRLPGHALSKLAVLPYTQLSARALLTPLPVVLCISWRCSLAYHGHTHVHLVHNKH